ncbi:MAG: methyltransferase domain-containing protein [Pseudonocardiaceae bacterium]|nr:methyltransferase domain-containing protein [Pseudonocardiaceae bacterium]
MAGASSQNVIPAWDGASYAANTGHHRRHDTGFLDTLPLRPGDRLLDLGCGSGDFTSQLAQRVPDGQVVGLDAEPSMLEQARRIAGPNQSFVLGPAQRLAQLCGPSGPFDAVTSRAMLHWVPAADHPGVLGAAASVLRTGGVLRLDAGGGDNVAAWRALLDPISTRVGGPASPWTFFQPGEYLERLEQAGFSAAQGWVRLVAQRRPFDRAGVIGWLTSQVLHAYTARMPQPAVAGFTAEALDRVDELRRDDGSYDVTFVRLDVLAHRGG